MLSDQKRLPFPIAWSLRKLRQFGGSIGIFIAMIGGAAKAQVGRDSPTLDDILDTSIPATETFHPHQFPLPSDLAEVPLPVSADEKQEISAWVKWLVLKNLPPNYEDNRKWNKHKEVMDGLHVHREGFKIETKRKWKSVRHGTWTRYTIEFLDPEKELVVDVSKIEFPTPGRIDVSCRIEAPLKLFGRVSQWQRDIQWYSLSADGRCRMEMLVDVRVQLHINTLRFPPDVEFAPEVTQATVRMKEFEIDRISKVGGDAAELVGKGIREVLDEKLEDYDVKLVEKMNREIAKQKDKLRISLGEWLQKSVGSRTPMPSLEKP